MRQNWLLLSWADTRDFSEPEPSQSLSSQLLAAKGLRAISIRVVLFCCPNPKVAKWTRAKSYRANNSSRRAIIGSRAPTWRNPNPPAHHVDITNGGPVSSGKSIDKNVITLNFGLVRFLFWPGTFFGPANARVVGYLFRLISPSSSASSSLWREKVAKAS